MLDYTCTKPNARKSNTKIFLISIKFGKNIWQKHLEQAIINSVKPADNFFKDLFLG